MENLVLEREINGGTQKLYRFENNYGASVVEHSFSYGTELAVIKFHGEDNENFSLDYKTPITDDVIGDLDEDSLHELLMDISLLKGDKK